MFLSCPSGQGDHHGALLLVRNPPLNPIITSHAGNTYIEFDILGIP